MLRVSIAQTYALKLRGFENVEIEIIDKLKVGDDFIKVKNTPQGLRHTQVKRNHEGFSMKEWII